MKVVFSFDDGRKDSIEAARIMKEYGIHGTFHITTGFIDGSFRTNCFGKNRQPLSSDDIFELCQNNFEISSHGDKHTMDYDDFCVSCDKLNHLTKSFNLQFGFSIPNSKYNCKEKLEFASKCKNKLSYIRVGRSPKCYSFFRKTSYVLYKLFKLQCFYNYFNKPNVIFDLDRFNIYSIVVKKHIRSKNILNFLKKYSKTDGTIVLMFHSISNEPKDDWEYSTNDFRRLCEFILKHKIATSSLRDIVKEN